MRSLRLSSTPTGSSRLFPLLLSNTMAALQAGWRVKPPRFPHRNLPWDILFLAQWTDPAQTNIHRDWARSGEEILRPFSENAHLLSALDVESEDVIKTAFGPNLQRLVAIKKKYDPANFFRVNHNINSGTHTGAA